MKPLPRTDGPNAPYWAGARRHELTLQACLDCGALRFPAARHCPKCRGERSAWRATGGGGVIESYCTFHKAYWPAFAAEVPYDVIQVRLDAGVRLFSNLVDAKPRVGMRVEAVFEPVDATVTLVKFRESAA